MKHRSVRGLIASTGGGGLSEAPYREWFTTTWHEDGQRTLRAVCELEPGLVADRSVLRDVTYTVDAARHPLDCFVRLHRNGSFLGSAWFRFGPDFAECEAFGTQIGRVSQRFEGCRVPSFGAHALTCDITHLERFDHSRPERVQPARGVMLSSLEHDGCSGPLLAPIDFGIEYVGRETLAVPAGTFEADHYRFLLAGSLPQEHPTEELWCTPGDFIFLKVHVGGALDTTYELHRLESVEGSREV